MSDGMLRFTEEQTGPTAAAAFAPTPWESATESSAGLSDLSGRRYDPETVQKALALAIEMQQEHKNTLSAAEVVSIGEEANVDPEFVLKALALLSADRSTASRAGDAEQTRQMIRRRNIKDGPIRLRRFPRWAKLTTATVPSVFMLLSLLVFQDSSIGINGTNKTFSLLWVFFFGPLLAVAVGAALRSKGLDSQRDSFLVSV